MPEFHQSRCGLQASPTLLGILSLLLVLLSGCSGDPQTGAKETKWDRDSCERCRMVLSDREHSAQIRIGANAPGSKVKFFDDIGCAVIWLQDKPFRDESGTEIWVTDWRDGQWIDARKAVYMPGQITPMQYGLGAQMEPADGGLNFEQASQHILKVEQRFNQHAAHLRQQAEQRQREKAGGEQ